MLNQVIPDHKRLTAKAAPTSAALRLSWLTPVAIILAVVYGSLIPFDLDWSLWSQGSRLAWPGLSGISTINEDLVVNILVYIPLGLAVVLAGRRTPLALMVRTVGAAVAGLSVSLMCEAAQIFITSRVASWVDVCLNLAGATIGALIGLGAVAAAPFASKFIRRALVARPIAMASVILTVGLFLFNLAPFDFSFHTSHLRESYLSASWQLLGGLTSAGLSQMAGETVADVAAALWFAALAFLIAFSRRRNGWGVAGAVVSAIKHCIVLIVIIELIELLTRTQRFEISTIVLRGCFAVAGAWATAWVARRMKPAAIRLEPRPAIPTSVLLVALAVQVGVLILWSLRPSRVEHLYSAGLTFEWLPFVSLWRQSAVVALFDVLSRFISVAALMITAAIVVRRIGGMTIVPVAGLAVLSLCIFAIAVRCLTVTAHLDLTEPLIAFLSVVIVASSYSRALTWASPVDFAHA